MPSNDLKRSVWDKRGEQILVTSVSHLIKLILVKQFSKFYRNV